MPIGEARRMARKRAGATVEIKLVESEEKQLHVVRQFSRRRRRAFRAARHQGRDRHPALDPVPPRRLPGADEENADFLQRFLLISAHLTSGIEERLEYLHEFFDPRLTQAGFLPWLAGWLPCRSSRGGTRRSGARSSSASPSCTGCAGRRAGSSWRCASSPT